MLNSLLCLQLGVDLGCGGGCIHPTCQPISATRHSFVHPVPGGYATYQLQRPDRQMPIFSTSRHSDSGVPGSVGCGFVWIPPVAKTESENDGRNATDVEARVRCDRSVNAYGGRHRPWRAMWWSDKRGKEMVGMVKE